MNILSLACLTAVADGGSIYADEYGVTWQVQGGKRVAVQIGDSEPLSIADMPASFQANLEAAVAGMAAGYNLAMAACNQTGLTADLSRRVQENEASAVESELRTNAVQQLAETNQATVFSMIECFGKGLLYNGVGCLAPAGLDLPCTAERAGALKHDDDSGETSVCKLVDDTYEYVPIGSASSGGCKFAGKAITGTGTASDPYRVPSLPLSCSAWNAELDCECRRSGVYAVSLGMNVYCDMETDGGGWQLLLTQLSGNDQYAGTTNPLTVDLDVSKPSPNHPYSRDWRNTFTPPIDSEFLIRRTDGQWVRFHQTYTWCGWDARGDCHGDSGHVHFTKGVTYLSDGSIAKDHSGRTLDRFNGCVYDGNCGCGGGDGLGFSSGPGWSHGSGSYGRCFGGGYVRLPPAARAARRSPLGSSRMTGRAEEAACSGAPKPARRQICRTATTTGLSASRGAEYKHALPAFRA